MASGPMLAPRATTPALRAFGTRLVTDHGRDLAAVRALARPLGISLAPKPNPVQQWALNEIGEESGADFDRDATKLAIGDHKMDIHDAKTEKAHGMNARIRAFAAASLTQLRLHLRIAEQTRKAQVRWARLRAGGGPAAHAARDRLVGGVERGRPPRR